MLPSMLKDADRGCTKVLPLPEDNLNSDLMICVSP